MSEKPHLPVYQVLKNSENLRKYEETRYVKHNFVQQSEHIVHQQFVTHSTNLAIQICVSNINFDVLLTKITTEVKMFENQITDTSKQVLLTTYRIIPHTPSPQQINFTTTCTHFPKPTNKISKSHLQALRKKQHYISLTCKNEKGKTMPDTTLIIA